MAYFPPPASPHTEFASDASGTWGCGAWCQDKWWQFEWPQEFSQGITFKEMFAVIVTAAVWGREWRGQHILGHCDNEAVTHMLSSRTSKNPHLMHLLRCLSFFEAEYQFTLSVVHITGLANDQADDLSHDKLSSFRSKVPLAQLHPAPFPQALPQLLLETQAMWTSPSWIKRFSTTVYSD